MAKELHQLDLFGNAHIAPVHIKRTKAHKVVAKKPLQMSAAVSEDHMMLNDEMPSVSRAPMHFGKNNTNHKRGRKSFASMEGDIDKLNVPSNEVLAKKLYYPIGEVAVWFNVNTSLIRYWKKNSNNYNPEKQEREIDCFARKTLIF